MQFIFIIISSRIYIIPNPLSRIPPENVFDMYKIVGDQKLKNNSEATYYGIGNFVNASKEGTYGEPGTFQSDQGFEDLIDDKSEKSLRKHVSDRLGTSMTDSKVDTNTIFYGVLLLYIKAFLRKKGFNEPLDTALGKICQEAQEKITFNAVQNIDGYVDGKGHMVLIR